MWDKIKSYGLKTLVLLVNLGLVAGGADYIKNQQERKRVAEAEQANADAQVDAEQISTKAQQLDQVIQKSANQKVESIAKNPPTVTVQQPKTVTQVIPGGTTTVKKPAATKTTKKS